MTYGDKLKEHVEELDVMTKADCEEALSKTTWGPAVKNEKVPTKHLVAFKAGLEHGLNLALKLAEEAKIANIVI